MIFSNNKARILPLLLIVAVWSVVFLFYLTSPYPYLPIHFQTIVLILLSIISFIIGYIGFHIFYTKEINIMKPADVNQVDSRILFYEKTLSKIVVYLSLIAFVGLLYKLLILSSYAGGVWEYLSNPIRARYIVSSNVNKIGSQYLFKETVVSYITNVNYIGLLFGGILFSVGGKYRKVSYLPLFISTLWSLITFQRWVLLMSIIYYLFSALYISYYLPLEFNKKVLKRIIRIAWIVLVIFLLFTFILISVRQDIEESGGLSSGKNVFVEYVLRSIHVYIVGNIISLDQFIQNSDHLYWGGSIFKVFFKWFARAGLYDVNQVIRTNYEFTWVGFETVNTYTYLRIFYEDFGQIGMILMSFLWGIIYYGVIHIFLKQFSMYRLFFVVVFIHAVLMSFYSFALTNYIFYVYSCLILFLINRIYPNIFFQFDQTEIQPSVSN